MQMRQETSAKKQAGYLTSNGSQKSSRSARSDKATSGRGVVGKVDVDGLKSIEADEIKYLNVALTDPKKLEDSDIKTMAGQASRNPAPPGHQYKLTDSVVPPEVAQEVLGDPEWT